MLTVITETYFYAIEVTLVSVSLVYIKDLQLFEKWLDQRNSFSFS